MIATVTAVFAQRSGAGFPVVTPEAIAAALLGTENVVTVRIADLGRVSVFRLDVFEGAFEQAAEAARATAAAVAGRLGADLDVVGVTLTADDDREAPLWSDDPARGSGR